MSLPYNYRQLMAPVDDTITKDQAWEMRMLNSKEGIERLQVKLEKEREAELIKIIKKSGNAAIKSIITNTGKIIKGNSLSVDDGVIKYNNKEVSLKQITLTDEKNLEYLLALAPKYYALKKAWKTVRNKEMKTKSFSSVADPNVNMEKFIEFLSGKRGVGQTAVHITHHQLAMAANIKYNDDVESYWIFDHNKIDGNASFAGKKDQDGEWISETLSGFVNAYVDIAADPYVFDMNAGNKTANMILMLVRSGASVPWITKFVSQPIIKDYIQAQRVNESLFNKAVGMRIPFKNVIVKQVIEKKYGLDDVYFAKVLGKPENDDDPKKFIYEINDDADKIIKDDLFKDYHNSEDKAEKERLIIEKDNVYDEAKGSNEQRWRRIKELKDNGLFSEEKLGQYILSNTLTELKEDTGLESISDITPNVYNEVQQYILDMYLEYQRQSKDFQMMIRATAADTKGAQKNMDDNKAWLKEVEEVKFKDRFTNLNKIYEESVISEVHKAVVESVKMFEPLYYFESNPVVSKAKRELIDVVEGSMTLTKDAKSKLASTVNNDLIAALATMNFNETEDGKKVVDKFSLGVAFEELFIKNDKNIYVNRRGEKAPLSEIIYELNNIKNKNDITSDNASILKLWGLRRNKLIKSLIGFQSNTEYTSYDGENGLKEQSEIGSTPAFQTIQFKAIKLDVRRENEFRNEFIKIKEFDEENGTNLFEDLIRFSFNQSGVQHNSSITFSNLIPNEEVTRILKDKFDKFDSLTPDTQKNILNEFKKQFLERTIEFTPTLRKNEKNNQLTIKSDSNTNQYSRFIHTIYDPETNSFKRKAVKPKPTGKGNFEKLTISRVTKRDDFPPYSPTAYKVFKDRDGIIRGHGRFLMGYELSLAPSERNLKVRKKQEEWKDFYEGKITQLKDDEMYIFGANDRGLHGAGGAGAAMDKKRTVAQISAISDGTVEKWAVKGETGLMQGNEGESWGIVTVQGKLGGKDETNRMPEDEIIEGIKEVYEHLRENPNIKGYVAYSNELNNKSLNGYTGEEMIKLFNLAGPIPPNAIFSKTWFDTGLLNRSETIVDEGVDPLSTVETETTTEVTEEIDKTSDEIGEIKKDAFRDFERKGWVTGSKESQRTQAIEIQKLMKDLIDPSDYKTLDDMIKAKQGAEYVINKGYATSEEVKNNALAAILLGSFAEEGISQKQLVEKYYVDTEFKTKDQKDRIFAYDGVEIETDFKLGDEQRQALEDMIEFMKDPNKRDWTLEGRAGTGKTTIIGLLEQYMKKKFNRPDYTVSYAAPTNAAAAYLALTTAELGNKNLPSTIPSSVRQNDKTKKWEFTFKVLELLDEDPKGRLFIVDESSMLEEKDIKNLRQAAKNSNTKIIFMGDSGQIPAVGDTTKKRKVKPDPKNIPSIFNENNKSKSTLETVYRQKDGPLLDLLGQMWEDTKYISRYVNDHDSIKFQPTGTWEKEYLKDFKNDEENNKQDSIIIAYTRKRVKELNAKVRKSLGKDEYTDTGDSIIGYIGYQNKQLNQNDLTNAVKYTITNIEKQDSIRVLTVNSQLLKRLKDLKVVGVKENTTTNYLQLSDTDSLKFKLTQKDFDKNNKIVSNIFRQIDELRKEAEKKGKRGFNREYFSKLELLTSLFKKIELGDDYVYDPAKDKMVKVSDFTTWEQKKYLNSLRRKKLSIEKGIDYGYAITIHKSQGLTMPNVYYDLANVANKTFLDKTSLLKDGEVFNTEMNALNYVGMSRASRKLRINKGNMQLELFGDTAESKNPFPESQIQEIVYHVDKRKNLNEQTLVDDYTTMFIQGVFFTTELEYAKKYAKDIDGIIYKAYIDSKSPFVTTKNNIQRLGRRPNELQSKYDSVIHKSNNPKADKYGKVGTEIVVYKPEQIKLIDKSTEEGTSNTITIADELLASVDTTEDVELNELRSTVKEKMEESMKGTSAKRHLKKELLKVDQATQFIGQGIGSTNKHKQSWGSKANTGNYTSDDVIMLAANGKRSKRFIPVKNGVLQGEYKNIDKAIAVNADFVADTEKHLKSSNYNIGEIELAKYLKSKGYTRTTIDGVGYWSTGEPKTTTTTKEFKPNKVVVRKDWKDYKGKIGMQNLNVFTKYGVNTLRKWKEGTKLYGHFGNPFLGTFRKGKGKTNIDNYIRFGTIKEAVAAYTMWLNGNSKYFNEKTGKYFDQDQRDWILKQIDSGKLDGKTLLYYEPKSVKQLDGTTAKKGYYSHADALAAFIKKRRGGVKTTTTTKGKKATAKKTTRKTTKETVKETVKKPDVVRGYTITQQGNLFIITKEGGFKMIVRSKQEALDTIAEKDLEDAKNDPCNTK